MNPEQTVLPSSAAPPPPGNPAPPAGATHADALNDANPWPGLDYYTEETTRYFHGRREEAEELLSRVRRRRITVLYGQSGLGKSSVLQAGLFPLLRKDAWFPIYIRLRYRPENPAENTLESLLSQSLKQIGNAIADGVAQGALIVSPEEKSASGDEERARDLAAALPRAGETLRDYLQRPEQRLRDKDGRPVALALAFDQFEELFTLGRTALRISGRHEFIRELAFCVENKPATTAQPASRETDPNGGDATVSGRPRNDHYRVILSLREDFLAHLNDLGLQMPTLLENQMRLCHMDGWKALQAIATPGKGIIEPLVAREIVRYVAAQDRDDDAEVKARQTPGEHRAHSAAAAREDFEEDYDHLKVDPAILSMACRELNAARIAREESKITSDLVKEMLQPGDTSLFRRFYDESFPVVKSHEGDSDPGPASKEASHADGGASFTEMEAAAVKRYIEDNLLEGKRRDFKSYDRAKADLLYAGVDDPEGVFQSLVNRRLLRISPGRDSLSMVVELTHDVLCDPVNRSREERLLHEAEERARIASELRAKSEIEEREGQRKRETELRKQAERDLVRLRREKRLGITICVLAVVTACTAGALAIFALSHYRAEHARSEKDQALWEQNRKQGNVYLNLAKARISSGKNAAALEYLSTAVRNDPRNLGAANRLWWLLGKKSWCWPINASLHTGRDNDVILCGGFSPDGKQIVALTQSGRLLTAKGPDFASFSESPSAAGGDGNSHTEPGAPLATATGACSSDGKRLLYYLHKTVPEPVKFWTWVEGTNGSDGHYETSAITIPPLESFRAAAWSGDGSLLVVTRSRRGGYLPCLVFKRKGDVYEEQKDLPEPFSSLEALAVDVSRDGKTIATSSSAGKVELWDTGFLQDQSIQPTPKVLFQTTDSTIRIYTVAFNPAADTLAAAAYHSAPHLWNTRSQKEIPLSHIADPDMIWRIAFNPLPGSPRICVTRLDGSTTVFDIKKQAPVAETIELKKWVYYASFSPDGQKLLTLSGMTPSTLETARVWNTTPSNALDDSQVRELQAKEPPVWLPDMAEAISGMHPQIDALDKPTTPLVKLRREHTAEAKGPEYGALWRRFLPDGDNLQ